MSEKDAIQEWLGTGFKGLLVAVIAIGTFVFNTNSTNLTKSIEMLTAELRGMQQHQVDTDKRVTVMEVSREINMAGYTKMQSDVQEMKNNIIQLTLRLQTISDFIARHFK